MKNQIAAFLNRLGISANFLTMLGLFLAGLSGYCLMRGQMRWSGFFLILSGLADLLDGAVARVSGTQSDFGGILDSTLDRYGDGFVLGGMTYFFFMQQKYWAAMLAFSAWIGAFSISYVRARSECEVDSCRVGFWERGERIGVLAAGLLVCNPVTAVLLLALGTHWTVFQRLSLAYAKTQPSFKETPSLPFYLQTGVRSDARYLLKIGVIVGLLAGLRI